MSDEEAQDAFEKVRYHQTDGEPFCHHCGCAVTYRIVRNQKSRAKGADPSATIRRTLFRCKACDRQFSVTSGTIFEGHKLSLQDILLAIALLTSAAKNLSALHLGRYLNVQYKTARVLSHRVREALAALQFAQELSGEVEIDATYVGGYVKPRNVASERVDRRRKQYRSDKRQCLVVLRERGRNGRVLPFVGTEAEAVDRIKDLVAPGSIIYADEAKAYNKLHALFEMRRIDHTQCYADNGVSTNLAESYWSRLKRAKDGTHHHIAGPNVDLFHAELSWREASRRLSNGEQFLTMAAACLHHPVSSRWRGYWQRWKAA